MLVSSSSSSSSSSSRRTRSYTTLRSTQVEYLKDKESAEDAAARLARLENTPNHKSKELKRLEERSAAAALKQADTYRTLRVHVHTAHAHAAHAHRTCTPHMHMHRTGTARIAHAHDASRAATHLETGWRTHLVLMSGGDRVQAQLTRGAVHRAAVEALRGGVAPGGGHDA